MRDPRLTEFLQTTAEDAAWINENSDVVQLVADPLSGDPADRYHGLFWQIEHLERSGNREIRVTREAVPFSLYFPEDYLRSSDRLLLFRVVTVHKPVFHPNQSGSRVQMGQRFQPGTPLHSLLHQLYSIVSGLVFATEDAFDAAARRYFLEHREKVKHLNVLPLYRRSEAAHVRFTPRAPGETAGEGEES